MKSILVAVDHTEASKTAQALAIELACRHQARLTGLGILDVAAIARPEPVPVGGMTIKRQRDQELIKCKRRQLDESLKAFGELCRTRGLEPQLLKREGSQLEQLEHEAARHDLIVIGRDTEFSPFAAEPGEVSPTVTGMLRDHPRPVIVTPPDLPDGEALLIIYDGRPGSKRLLQILIALNLQEGWTVRIMGLGREAQAARQNAQEAQEYLADHEIFASIMLNEHTDDEEYAVLEAALSLKARIVALAARRPHGWHGLLHGSADRQLLKKSSSAILVDY